MSGRFLITLALLLGLSACANSRLNPLNWFAAGRDDGVILEPRDGYGDSADTRELIARVTSLKVLRTPEGALLQVTGLPPRLGYWSAELVAENDGKPVDGVLTYSFRIAEPPGATPRGAPDAREIIVAAAVPEIRLAGVRRIRVIGATNSMSARR